MRIIFMGTPEFSVPILEKLLNSEHEIVAVYSQPPRPAGRGQKVRLSPVHSLAEKHNLTVFTPENFKSEKDIDNFKNLNADIAVVVAYGLILPEEILNAPKYGCLNIHASLLPRWRGAAPIQRAILAGDKKTGICIMQMEKGLDTGSVILKKEIVIENSETATSLHDKLSELGSDAIIETLDLYKNNDIPKAYPQEGETSYAHMLTKEEGQINWQEETAEEIERRIRALNPWPSVWCLYNGDQKRLKILDAKIVEVQNNNYLPATILDKELTISCKNNSAIKLITVKPEGKKAMSGKDFFNGSQYSIFDELN